MNQPGENGCGVEFKGSDGVDITEELITADGKYVRLEVTVKKLPMDGIITIDATPNSENQSLLRATYTVDLSGLYPVELRIVFHDTYNTMTFTENLVAYAYILDKLQKIREGDDPVFEEPVMKLRNLFQFEIGDYFLLPAPSDGKQWRLSFTDSNGEPVDQYYAGNSFYVIKEEHIDATNAIHFYASSAPAPAPETAKVIFVYGENAEIRALPFGTLEVPEDINVAAQRQGFDLKWYCDGEMITEETQVADGMVVVARYVPQYMPGEYSENMVVALKVANGKIYYTVVALDGKAVPAGYLRIGYAYTVDLGEWGTTIGFDKVDVEVTNENSSEFITGFIDLPEGALTVSAVFTYDGGSESTPAYVIANEATQ